MNYLLDTCVISDFFKKIPSVVENFEKISPKQIYVSTITIMEIEYGLQLNQERAKKIRPLWESLVKYIQIVPYCDYCGIASASIRSNLKKEGLPIGPYDILIAGTALAHHLIAVTSNFHEFARISELTVENWRK